MPSPSCGTRPTVPAASLQPEAPRPGARRRRHPPSDPSRVGPAAAARHDVHIERVWPMRSPPIGPLEGPSSAYFQLDRRGTPPAGIEPIGGLRMSQALPPRAGHGRRGRRPVRGGPTRPGGRRHRRGRAVTPPPSSRRHEHLGLLGLDRDPGSGRRRPQPRCSPSGVGPIVSRRRFDELAAAVREQQRTSRGQPGQGLVWRALRPRRVVAAARHLRAGLLLPPGRTTRHAHGPDVGPHRRRRGQRLRGGGPRRAVRRERRGPVRPPHRPGRGRRPPHRHHGAAGRDRAQPPSPPPPAGRAATPPAGCSRPSGSPSTRRSNSSGWASSAALDLLEPGGRCLVIAYHSGEDRLVKSIFARAATGDCRCPPGLPCVCGAVPEFALVTRGARRPSAAEVSRNRRAESARLRVIERLPEPPEDASADGEVA